MPTCGHADGGHTFTIDEECASEEWHRSVPSSSPTSASPRIIVAGAPDFNKFPPPTGDFEPHSHPAPSDALDHSHAHSHTHSDAHSHTHSHSHSHAHCHSHPGADSHSHPSADSHSHSSPDSANKSCACSSGDAAGWKAYLPHSHGLEQRLAADKRTLVTALAILCGACTVQVLLGSVARSRALYAEAVHSALDGLTVVLSLVAAFVGARSPTSRMPYGYGRAETLAALASVSALAVLCVKLAYGATLRLWAMYTGNVVASRVEGRLVFLAEVLTLAANITMAVILTAPKDGQASRSWFGQNVLRPFRRIGSNEEDYEEEAAMHVDPDSAVKSAPQNVSLNIRALRAHIIADSVENVIVLLAGLLMWAVPSASVVDPVLTLLIVALLVYLNAPIAREACRVLLQASPRWLDMDALRAGLSRVDGVVAVPDLRVWTLTCGVVVAAASVCVPEGGSASNIERVRVDARAVVAKAGVGVVTLEVVQVPAAEDSHSHSLGSSAEPCSSAKASSHDVENGMAHV